MDDSELVRSLRRQLDHHRRQVERLEVALDVIEAETRRSDGKESAARVAKTVIDLRDKSHPVAQASAQPGTADMVRAILADTVSPMRPAQIVEQIEKRGWRVDAANPISTVRTAAHRLVSHGEAATDGEGAFVLAEQRLRVDS